jgi:hypothetical protein
MVDKRTALKVRRQTCRLSTVVLQISIFDFHHFQSLNPSLLLRSKQYLPFMTVELQRSLRRITLRLPIELDRLGTHLHPHATK